MNIMQDHSQKNYLSASARSCEKEYTPADFCAHPITYPPSKAVPTVAKPIRNSRVYLTTSSLGFRLSGAEETCRACGKGGRVGR